MKLKQASDALHIGDRKQVDRLRTQVAMVFQNFCLWSHMTVLENLMEAPVHVQRRSRSEVRDEEDIGGRYRDVNQPAIAVCEHAAMHKSLGIIVSHQPAHLRAENSLQPVRRRERMMKRFKSAWHLQRFVSIHDPTTNLFQIPRHDVASTNYRALRGAAMKMWNDIARLQTG